MTGALGAALIDPVHMLAERAMANGDAVPGPRVVPLMPASRTMGRPERPSRRSPWWR